MATPAKAALQAANRDDFDVCANHQIAIMIGLPGEPFGDVLRAG